VENVVTYVYAKFGDDRLWNEKLDLDMGLQALPTLLFLLLVLIRLFRFTTDCHQTSHTDMGDNIIHNRTVTDFPLKS